MILAFGLKFCICVILGLIMLKVVQKLTDRRARVERKDRMAGKDSNLATLATDRHEGEVKALVQSIIEAGGTPEQMASAIVKNVWILAVFTAGRVVGSAQTAHITRHLQKKE